MSKRSSDPVGVEPPPPGAAGLATFDHVYATEFPFVWRCLRSLGVPTAALDDAAQDVFVIVHRQLAGFRGESSLRSWLFGLDDDKRAMFALGILEEMSIPEVAQALGIPLNTAYTRLRRVRAEFQQALIAAKEQP